MTATTKKLSETAAAPKVVQDAMFGGLLPQRMKGARTRLYEATREIDAIWRRRRAFRGPEALEVALRPYIQAAEALPQVSFDNEE
jgi:hypothetical protein